MASNFLNWTKDRIIRQKTTARQRIQGACRKRTPRNLLWSFGKSIKYLIKLLTPKWNTIFELWAVTSSGNESVKLFFFVDFSLCEICCVLTMFIYSWLVFSWNLKHILFFELIFFSSRFHTFLQQKEKKASRARHNQ